MGSLWILITVLVISTAIAENKTPTTDGRGTVVKSSSSSSSNSSSSSTVEIITTSSKKKKGKREGIKVKIENGEIKGHMDTSRGGLDFYGFTGIPYAKPPVGGLRFQVSVAIENWQGVKDVYNYGEPCPQIDGLTKKLVGNEDCLFINVFSPKNTKTKGKDFSDTLLSVMVYIHGGDFTFGSSSSYEPHYFMDKEVVFVSFNYRLGSLGFLNTEDSVVRGNMGLKDQVLALKWVQQNIKIFGGDPTKVTLFGHGSGGACVHYHLLSSMSSSLFSKAMSLSGSAIAPFSMQAKPLDAAKRLGLEINCPVDSTENLVKCLKDKPVEIIVNVHFQDRQFVLRDPLSNFAPSLEKTNVNEPDTFITEHPYALLNSGHQKRVPWMSGVNSEEGLMETLRILADEKQSVNISSFFEVLAPQLFAYNPDRTDITNSIKEFYFSIKPGSNTTIDFKTMFDGFTKLFSDRYYHNPHHDAVAMQSKWSDVYAYYNSYQNNQSSFNSLLTSSPTFPPFAVKNFGDLFKQKDAKKPTKPGVCHMDDIILMFKVENAEIADNKNTDFDESNELSSAFTQFSIDESKLKMNGVKWTKVKYAGTTTSTFTSTTTTEIEYMVFKTKDPKAKTEAAAIVKEPTKDRVKFWGETKLNSYGC